jgi:hypothetical protein
VRTLAVLALLLAAEVPTRAQEPAPEPARSPVTGLAPWNWEITTAHLRIATALRAARRAGPGDRAGLAEKIVGSGRDAVPASVDILLRGRVPETAPTDGPQLLSDPQRDLLLVALARMPAKSVQQELESRLAKSPDDTQARLGAMYALGIVGEATDLVRLVALAPRKGEDKGDRLTFESREALRLSTLSLLRRLPQALPTLAAELRTADTQAAGQLIDALAASHDPRTLRVLLATVRSNPKLAGKAASVVPACGSSLDAETDREFLEWVRREYAGAEPAYARTLLRVVGVLDDGAWVPALIERLSDEDSGLREEALAALRQISGLGFPADPAAWRNWYDGESRWHAERRPKLLQQLSSPESPKVLAAVREYAEHRTRRGEMAEELVTVLQHGRPEVRTMVLNALGRLGSPAACPALLTMLSDPDHGVAEAAFQALRTICGAGIPRDPEALRELFGRS